MADYVTRTTGTPVSHHWVANLWREYGLKPQKQGTFKLSKDPAFADKVADIVGLYLDPPGGAVVLSLDEKTQIQALDRTQPLLPIEFDRSEQRTHDYVRHGTTIRPRPTTHTSLTRPVSLQSLRRPKRRRATPPGQRPRPITKPDVGRSS
jgi:hypothetical protein